MTRQSTQASFAAGSKIVVLRIRKGGGQFPVYSPSPVYRSRKSHQILADEVVAASCVPSQSRFPIQADPLDRSRNSSACQGLGRNHAQQTGFLDYFPGKHLTSKGTQAPLR